MWWAAAPPCVSVYLPVSVSSPELPEMLESAGTGHGTGPSAEGIAEDSYTVNSYWWAFQRLLEVIAGDELGSTYDERQPIARERLDALQQSWSDQVGRLTADASPRDWQELTARCTAEALVTANQLAADLSA